MKKGSCEAGQLQVTKQEGNARCCTSDDSTNLCADLGGVSSQGLQHSGCHTLTLTQEAQQNVLCANVVVTCASSHKGEPKLQFLQDHQTTAKVGAPMRGLC